MAYDPLVESIALIEGGNEALQLLPTLSNGRRFVPMAVDVADDFAATMFLRRSVGYVEQEVWQLALRHGTWQMLGGDAGPVSYTEDPLAERPGIIPLAVQEPERTLPGIDPLVMIGGDTGGGVLDTMGTKNLFPWSGRWISYAVLNVSAQVCSVRLDARNITVPWHGRTLLTWAGRTPVRVSAYDKSGQNLGTARIPS